MERLDSNYILNAIFQSGGTVDVREDSNFILNTVFDSTNNALKVGLSGDINIDAISASTIYSGGTDLYDIFLTSAQATDITRVQPGTNITTGGTANEPIVNLVDNVIVTNISATTFYSGSTELGSLFGTGAGTVTSVSAGDANIEIGGTAADPTVSLADSISVDGITASGTCEAATITSGGTNIDTLFASTTHAHAISDVTDLSLQLAGKSATGHTHVSSEVTDLGDLLGTKANLSGASFTGAITSGGTDLYNIFLTEDVHVGDVVSVAAEDANIEIGGTAAAPTVGLADNVNVVNLSATTFYSGSTELSTLFGTGAGTVASVTAGDANIEIGGTAADPTVSLADSPSINNLTASGLTTTQTLKVDGLADTTERFLTTTDGNIAAAYEAMDIVGVMSAYTGALSCTDLSATTIYSGSTNIETLFAPTTHGHVISDVTDLSLQLAGKSATGHTHTTANVTNLDNLLATKANLSGTTTFTGNVTVPISTSNLSGAGFISQGFAISDETTQIVSGTTAALTYYAPFAFKITSVYACLTTSGSTVSTFDIHEAGTTILSTKITIDANEFTTATAAAAPVVSDANIAANSKIEFFIDGAGTGAKGAKIFINGYKA